MRNVIIQKLDEAIADDYEAIAKRMKQLSGGAKSPDNELKGDLHKAKDKSPNDPWFSATDHRYHTRGGDWYIYHNPGHPDGDWSYTHEDYDGPGDPRGGAAKSPQECAKEIDERFPETHEEWDDGPIF